MTEVHILSDYIKVILITTTSEMCTLLLKSAQNIKKFESETIIQSAILNEMYQLKSADRLWLNSNFSRL